MARSSIVVRTLLLTLATLTTSSSAFAVAQIELSPSAPEGSSELVSASEEAAQTSSTSSEPLQAEATASQTTEDSPSAEGREIAVSVTTIEADPVTLTTTKLVQQTAKKSDAKPAQEAKTKQAKTKKAKAPESAETELPRVALTEAPKQDLDFELMGEFVGPIEIAENKYEPIGLQIRPIGNGRFEAIQYAGGLPGQESFSDEEPQQLIGRRSGDFVVLSGGEYAIFVEPASCLLVDRTGKRIGRLERVQRGSPTMGAQPPTGATILFDGSDTEQFTTANMTDAGLLKEGADTLPLFQDFNLHVEFRLPYMPNSDGQKRGNSGCYLQSRYEVQVLDSFGTLPVFNGCSALYRIKAPDLNMCLPPLQWQTYDIQFTAPRWGADGSKLRNARITVWQNGIKTQDDFEIPSKTGAGKVEAPTLLPIRFQNHSDPVRYRNIWIVDRGLAKGEFPVTPVEVTESETGEGTEASDVTETTEVAEASEASAETAGAGSETDGDSDVEESEGAQSAEAAASSEPEDGNDSEIF